MAPRKMADGGFQAELGRDTLWELQADKPETVFSKSNGERKYPVKEETML